jgi:hypothetical protein
MTLLKGKIAESTLLGIPKGKYDGLTVKLRSSMQSIQVGVWKTFGVLNIKLNLDGQGRQPPAVTAQPPTGKPPAASHQLFAATAASRLHT